MNTPIENRLRNPQNFDDHFSCNKINLYKPEEHELNNDNYVYILHDFYSELNANV